MTDARTNPTSLELHGIGISSGILVGKSRARGLFTPAIPHKVLTEEQIPAELQRLEQAVQQATSQLTALKEELRRSLGEEHSHIVDFHLELLREDELCESIIELVRKNHCGLEQAIQTAVREACEPLINSGKPFFQERATDIKDVGDRLLQCMMKSNAEQPAEEDGEPVILLCEELPPSVAARLSPKNVAAILSASGSRTSHSAILVQSLGIPAIAAIREDITRIPDGTTIAVDARRGIAIVNPDQKTLDDFLERKRQYTEFLNEMAGLADKPSETLDGYQTRLVVNVALPQEALLVKELYHTGIGLFRTEFLFMDRGQFLSEEEQFNIYSRTVRAVFPYSVIFRTLDLGGDKILPVLAARQETNPFMGMRAIRHSLLHPELFKAQLRALLRATTEGKMRVMFPMISTIDELKTALAILDEVKTTLAKENIPFSDDFDIGCMIEVPSAVQIADQLIQYVDFFSIGTNDLTQYTLAVDRGNASVAHLYQPANPAVLRQIKHAADIAIENGKWISVCGEMAGDPLYTPLILGMGIHELSMSPVALPSVQNVLRNIRVYEAEELLEKALACHDGQTVLQLCRDFLRRACPQMPFQEPK